MMGKTLDYVNKEKVKQSPANKPLSLFSINWVFVIILDCWKPTFLPVLSSFIVVYFLLLNVLESSVVRAT